MNKEEILEEISKTKKHLANMEKMLKEHEYKRWRPVRGEQYFTVSARGVMDCVNIDEVLTGKHYAFYNCFQTREQAEAEVEKIVVRRQLEVIAKRLNKGEKIDWENPHQHKYSIYFDYREDKIDTYPTTVPYKEQGTVYCLDRNFKDVAIEEIGKERLLKYLRGE